MTNNATMPTLAIGDVSQLSGITTGTIKTFICRRQFPFLAEPVAADRRTWRRFCWNNAFLTMIAAELSRGDDEFDLLTFPAAAHAVSLSKQYVLSKKNVLLDRGGRHLFLGYAWCAGGRKALTGTWTQIAESMANSYDEPDIDQTTKLRALALVNLNRAAQIFRERAQRFGFSMPVTFWNSAAE